MLTEIRTFTGKFIDPINPNPDLIDIKDIAHSLARMPRFAGHTKKFYSVAEHCLRCLQVAPDSDYKLELLLHDATEAYIMDIPSPVKNRLPEYQKVEQNLARHIDIAFGLYSVEYHRQIKEIDQFVLQEELSYVLENNEAAPLWYQTERTFDEVEYMFLTSFHALNTKEENGL